MAEEYESIENNSLDDKFEEADVFADFDMGSEQPKGRTPASPAKVITKNLLNMASSFTESAAAEVENSLPRTSSLIGEVKSFKDDLEALKSDVQRDLRPTVNAVKRAMHKSMPMAKDFIPKKLYELLDSKLKDWEEESTKRDKTRDEVQQEQIAATLAEIFGVQEKLRLDERENVIANQLVDRVMESKRHKDQLAALTAIDSKLLFQADFTRTTQSAWMKKMLELQYISVFTAKEHVGISKVIANILEFKLEEIKHNTSLPDLLKTKRNEYVRSLIRGRALAKIGDTAANYLGGFRDRFGKFAQEKILGGIKATRQFADMGSGLADMAADAKQMAESSGMEQGPSGTAGGIVGKIAGIPIGRRIAGTLSPILSEIEDASGNIKETAYFKGKQFKEKLQGSGNILLQALATIIPEHQEQRTVANTALDKPFEPISFDVGTRTAIVEVIPGYLSMIDKSLRDLVTGDTTEARRYDVTKRSFATATKAAEGAVSYAFGKEDVRSQAALHTVGTIKGTISMKAGEEGKEAFKRVQRDIFRFVTNVSISNIFLEPASIKEYADSDEIDPSKSNAYVARTFRGLERPKETAQILVSAMYNGDDLDVISLRQIQNAISRSIQAEGWKDLLPTFIEGQGQWELFRQMGAFDERNNIKDEFLEDVLLNVKQERFEREVEASAGTAERTLKRRKEEKLLLRESVTDRLPGMVTSVADRIKDMVPAGLMRNIASFFTTTAEEIEKQDFGGIIRGATEQASAAGGEYLQKARQMVGTAGEGLQDAKRRVQSVDIDSLKEEVSSLKARLQEATGEAMDSVTDATGKIDVATLKEKAKSSKNWFVRMLGKVMPLKEDATEKVTESISAIKESLGTLTDKVKSSGLVDQFGKQLGVDGSPMVVTMATTEGAGDTSVKVYDFHQDFLRYFEYRQLQDAALLDAILNQGANVSKSGIMSKLGKLGGALGRGSKTIIDMYGNIYGGLLKGTGTALGKGFDFGKAALPYLGRGLGGLGTLLGKGIGAYGDIYGGLLKGTGSAIGGAFNMLTGGGSKKKFVDVYRKDKIEVGNPLVTVRVQKKYARKASGAKLEQSADITEPILHVESGETLVSQDDIDAGLVDQFGKELGRSEEKAGGGGLLGSAIKGLGSLGGGLGKGLGSLLGGAFGGYGAILKGALGLGGDAVKGITGLFKRGKDEKAIVERLDTIIEILRERMPPPKSKVEGDFDGDGDRDGSYQDLMNEKKRLEAKKKLASTVGAGTAVKKGTDEDKEAEEGSLLGGTGKLAALLGAGKMIKQHGLKGAIGQAFRGSKVGQAASWLRGTKLGTTAASKLASAGGVKGLATTGAAKAGSIATGAKGLAATGFAKAGGVAGLKGAAAKGGPLAALAQMTYGATATALDDERAEAHTEDLMARQEAINKKLGIFGYGGAGTVAANFGLDKIGASYSEKGVWGGTKETGKNLLTGFVRMGDNIGAAANLSVDAYQESQGPDEYRQLLEALKKQKIVKDPWGWGKWKVLDWDAIAKLPERDLQQLYGYGDEHFSDEDVERFAGVWKDKSKTRRAKKEEKKKELEKDKAQDDASKAVKPPEAGVLPKPSSAITPATAASPTASTYQKSAADLKAQEVEMIGKKTDQPMDELTSLSKRQVEAQESLAEAVKQMNMHLSNVEQSTGELGKIKDGLDKNLEKATEQKPVIVNTPKPEEPKISVPSIRIAKTV